MEERPTRILFFSDWRIQPMEWIDWMLDEAGDVDFVVYGGDDTRRFAPLVDWPRVVLARANEVARDEPTLGSAVATMATILGQTPIVVPETEADPSAAERLSAERILRHFPLPPGNYFQRIAERARHGVGAVIGNDCMPEDRVVLRGAGVFNLHQHPTKVGVWGFVGIEGNIVSQSPNGRWLSAIGPIFHRDEEVETLLERGLGDLCLDERHLVVVSHTPPRGLLDLAIRFGIEHLGSPTLGAFIRKRAPALVLCGHVHNQGGMSVRLGNTLVVNAASGDTRVTDTRGALIELEEGVAPKLSWLDPARHSTVAISGVGPKSERRLAGSGITTADALYSASIRELIDAGIQPGAAARLTAKGSSFHTGTPVWLESRHQHVPENVVLYDVETGLTSGRFSPFTNEVEVEPWLIAACACAVDDEVSQWAAPDEDRSLRRRMLEDFLDLVAESGNTTCAWSGTGFDDRAIAAGLARWYPRGVARWEKVRKLDLCRIMKQALEVPGSWSIKNVSRFLGWQGPEEEWNGFQAGLAYEAYRKLGEPFEVEAVKRYNRLDVEQLAFTYRWYAKTVRSRAAQRRDTTNAPRARWTPEALAALQHAIKQGLTAYEIELPGYTLPQIRWKMTNLRRSTDGATTRQLTSGKGLS